MTGFRTLSEFLDHVESRGDLKRVTREVDWAYEVTEIACREAKAEGDKEASQGNLDTKIRKLACNVVTSSQDSP